MGKTGYIMARVEPKLKASAGKVLAKIGVSTSDAITMFLRQVVLRRGIPFDVRIPNAETKRAIEELENPTQRARVKKRGTTEEMFADILGKKANQAKKRV